MVEIKEFPTRGGSAFGGKQAKERPEPFNTTQGKPEKPAEIVPNEKFEERRREILLKKEQKELTKSPGQRKGEAQQRFMDKIKDLKTLFGKEEENK